MSDPENTTAKGDLRTTGGKFAPGRSGNPGGRPKAMAALREAAQAHGLEAVEGLLQLARDDGQPGAVRKGAWDSLLDRGFGKPTIGEPDEDGRQAALILQVLSGVARGEGE